MAILNQPKTATKNQSHSNHENIKHEFVGHIKSEKLQNKDKKKSSFKCDVCNKCFRFSSFLLNHQLAHTDERPFKCDVCNSSFKRSCDLNSHKRIHNNERRFECNLCKRSFKYSNSLKCHINKRHHLT